MNTTLMCVFEILAAVGSMGLAAILYVDYRAPVGATVVGATGIILFALPWIFKEGKVKSVGPAEDIDFEIVPAKRQ